ncbi:peroxiredoxin [Paramaledivibacter caminithermalis]|jgi:alkyl hydroperoxide reductase subunit AhpC|uniref:Alkyl hydroperoxide reductase subunit AhpC (Peroxiredoxin) n=1 Tax=Paramaledivibacter caminithermalis (strain DSM 15212 / CIP 107654 / DViRD3) TaxID=1121301 RepID=A0A1M6RM02_PARC5|nr:peroxiredoxin [Paramaledivibacter caminithermalis]SHK33474.1 Alkyl hydroperoxide reductase subunit AhpC (peroxiredoxin) [Paramaledivibacter caminithermalis DSM 15212]
MAERIVGVKAPNFEMKTALGDGENFSIASLADYKGKWLVLFFYPLDFTFVCPTEITGFSTKYEDFKKLNADILAVSTDSIYSHKAWMNLSPNEGGLGRLKFPIASDITHKVSRDYGVLVEEEGIALRGLFIIDPDGVIKYSVIHDLNVGRSTDEVLRVLKALQTGGLCPLGWEEGDELL